MHSLKNLFLFLLGIVFFIACDPNSSSSSSSTKASGGGGILNDKVIWKGAKKIFTKSDNTDHNTQEANQDRITDKVWLSRSKAGGALINVKVDTVYSKTTSPSGTKWAKGTTANLDSLEFKVGLHNLGKLKNLINQNLVLWLTEENIFIDIKITSWSAGKKGGFAYERSAK